MGYAQVEAAIAITVAKSHKHINTDDERSAFSHEKHEVRRAGVVRDDAKNPAQVEILAGRERIHIVIATANVTNPPGTRPCATALYWGLAERATPPHQANENQTADSPSEGRLFELETRRERDHICPPGCGWSSV